MAPIRCDPLCLESSSQPYQGIVFSMIQKRTADQANTALITPIRGRNLSTKELLITVGEQLFGQHGFEGVSLREIAVAAGQSNANVVQYHFGDKPGLVTAILHDRIDRVEQVREMQLALIEGDAALTPRQLLKLLWLPLLSITDGQGGHPFCHFMLQYMLHPKFINHPLAATYSLSESGSVSVSQAARQLFKTCSGLPKELVIKRISGLVTMFLASVVEHDNARIQGQQGTADTYDINPILDMAVAALVAPDSDTDHNH